MSAWDSVPLTPNYNNGTDLNLQLKNNETPYGGPSSLNISQGDGLGSHSHPHIPPSHHQLGMHHHVNHGIPYPQQPYPILAPTTILQHEGYGNNSEFGMKLPTNSPVPLISSHGPLPVVPHTPQGVPVGNPFTVGLPHVHPGVGGPEKVPDLPQSLIDIGWTKCWSKREGRYYFFNTMTNESLWDLPPLPPPLPSPSPLPRPHHGPNFDPYTDPLGIQHGGLHAGMKRRASSGEQLIGSPAAKRAILSGPWDLEVLSNVYVSEPPYPRPSIFPPHPQTELLRYQLLTKLRQCFQQTCKSREGIDGPKESLSRWLLEQKIGDKKLDPVFPCREEGEGSVSNSLFREIMNDVPMRVIKTRFTGDARKQLAKFAESCKKAIETRSASSDERKLVIWKVEETFRWLQDSAGAPYEAFQERLAHLRETIQPPVHKAATNSVEGICKKMSKIGAQYAEECAKSHANCFIEPRNVKRDYPIEIGRFKSYPVLAGAYTFKDEFLPPPTKSLVDHLIDKENNVLIKFKNDHIRIPSFYYHKLSALYTYNDKYGENKAELFLTRVYCLTKRYNAVCNEFNSCHSTQGSLPTPVFESIQRNFGVTFECFSSPFNCYFRSFCSAFPDTDGYFGSAGNFLEFFPVSGSFQMNPPLCSELIDAAITHVETILGGSQEPLSFIIFVPEFEEREDVSHHECAWISRLQNSVWKKRQVKIPPFEHEFRSGAQHLVPKAEVGIRSSHTTWIFWLQNESGEEEWRATDERVDSLIDSYRPGRERERDRQDLLSPERQNPHQADKAVAAAKAISISTPLSPALTPSSSLLLPPPQNQNHLPHP